MDSDFSQWQSMRLICVEPLSEKSWNCSALLNISKSFEIKAVTFWPGIGKPVSNKCTKKKSGWADLIMWQQQFRLEAQIQALMLKRVLNQISRMDTELCLWKSNWWRWTKKDLLKKMLNSPCRNKEYRNVGGRNRLRVITENNSDSLIFNKYGQIKFH